MAHHSNHRRGKKGEPKTFRLTAASWYVLLVLQREHGTPFTETLERSILERAERLKIKIPKDPDAAVALLEKAA